MTTCTTNPHQIRNNSTIRNEFTTSDPVSQESSTSVGLPAREKTAKVGRVLFEQIGPQGVVQTGSSFGSQVYPRSLRMVPSDRRQNFLHFLFPGPRAYLASFWSYGEKTKFQKKKVGCHGNVPRKFENRGSDRSSAAIAELNGENRVKIRPVEVEIIGLTKNR